MSGFFRYPGGKSKFKDAISRHLNVWSGRTDLEYREPFFGGGGVGLGFITDNPNWKKFWINDKDIGVACLWTSVIRHPEKLNRLVCDFVPSIESFDRYKEDLIGVDVVPNCEDDVVLLGFKKLAIHQISYSGLGTKSGGPLGGRNQKSEYKINCRWSPSYIQRKIDHIHKMFSRLDIRSCYCSCLDFESIVRGDGEAILYLDPPYYNKGNEMYQCQFSVEDHKRLSTALRETRNWWILSYDDCEEVRAMYDWANIEVLSVNYTITATKDESGKRLSRRKNELLISPKDTRK